MEGSSVNCKDASEASQNAVESEIARARDVTRHLRECLAILGRVLIA